MSGHEGGGIRIDGASEPFSRFMDGGVSLANAHGVGDISWLSFDHLEDGALSLQHGSGYYDFDRHFAVAAHRSPAFRAVPILDGLAYAYRTWCDRCSQRRDVLHLVTPVPGFGFTTQTVGGAPASRATARSSRSSSCLSTPVPRGASKRSSRPFG